MARYKLIAMSSPKEGQEAEFNSWYDGTHLPDVLAIPGFISGERFVNVFPNPYRYVAIYEIETDDLQAVLAQLTGRAGTGQMIVSDALDPASVLMTFCQPYPG